MGTNVSKIVRVRRLSLDLASTELERLRRLLSDDELERAGRFRAGRRRDRFVAGRGQLRRILAETAGCEPRELVLRAGPHGKPELSAPTAAAGIRFNLSHSRDRALVAVAHGRAVGVDLEWLRSDRDIDAIADRYFAPEESRALRELRGAERVQAFFRCWTRKEAWVKALGVGLLGSMPHLEVGVGPAPAPRQGAHGEPAAAAASWSLVDLDVAAGFAAALAVERAGRDVEVRYLGAGNG